MQAFRPPQNPSSYLLNQTCYHGLCRDYARKGGVRICSAQFKALEALSLPSRLTPSLSLFRVAPRLRERRSHPSLITAVEKLCRQCSTQRSKCGLVQDACRDCGHRQELLLENHTPHQECPKMPVMCTVNQSQMRYILTFGHRHSHTTPRNPPSGMISPPGALAQLSKPRPFLFRLVLALGPARSDAPARRMARVGDPAPFGSKKPCPGGSIVDMRRCVLLLADIGPAKLAADSRLAVLKAACRSWRPIEAFTTGCCARFKLDTEARTRSRPKPRVRPAVTRIDAGRAD